MDKILIGNLPIIEVISTSMFRNWLEPVISSVHSCQPLQFKFFQSFFFLHCHLILRFKSVWWLQLEKKCVGLFFSACLFTYHSTRLVDQLPDSFVVIFNFRFRLVRIWGLVLLLLSLQVSFVNFITLLKIQKFKPCCYRRQTGDLSSPRPTCL